MVRVLFVCMGNICRSPMAEGLFKHKLVQQGLQDAFHVDSAGMGNWHEGELPDYRMRKVAESKGVILDSRARQIQPRDLREMDYIIVMDQTNYDYVAQLMRSRPSSAKLLKVREFDPQETDAPDLPDPYSGGMDGFELVYEQLDRSLDVFIEHLKEKHSLVVPN